MTEESAEQLVRPALHPIYPHHFDELIFKNKAKIWVGPTEREMST